MAMFKNIYMLANNCKKSKNIKILNVIGNGSENEN
jgi:hypothetical protein